LPAGRARRLTPLETSLPLKQMKQKSPERKIPLTHLLTRLNGDPCFPGIQIDKRYAGST
jgi:hypothetical protein